MDLLNGYKIKDVENKDDIIYSTKNPFIVDHPQITFMKSIYHRYERFTNITVPIQIVNIKNRNAHVELSSFIRSLGANFINGISVDINKQYPIESITLYYDNNYELYHIDLLNFLSYLKFNKIIDCTDSSLLTVPYKNVEIYERKVYFEINFKEKYPDNIDLFLDLYCLTPDEFTFIVRCGYNIILYHKNYFEHNIDYFSHGNHQDTFDLQFDGQINQILILLIPDKDVELELYASLIRDGNTIYHIDPHINKIILSDKYHIKQHIKNHYIMSFCEEPFKNMYIPDNSKIKDGSESLTMTKKDIMDVVVKPKNEREHIRSVKIKIWGVTR